MRIRAVSLVLERIPLWSFIDIRTLKLFLFEDPVDDPELGVNTVSRVEKVFKIYHYLLSKLPNLEHLSVAEGPSRGSVFYGLLEASQGRSPSIDATDNIGGPSQQPEPLDPFVGRLKTLQIEYTIYGSGDDFWRPMIPVLDQLTSLKHLVLNVGWTSNWCPCHMLGRIPSSLDTLVLRGTIPCPAAIIVRAIADRHSNIQTLITSGSPDVFDTTVSEPLHSSLYVVLRVIRSQLIRGSHPTLIASSDFKSSR